MVTAGALGYGLGATSRPTVIYEQVPAPQPSPQVEYIMRPQTPSPYPYDYHQQHQRQQQNYPPPPPVAPPQMHDRARTMKAYTAHGPGEISAEKDVICEVLRIDPRYVSLPVAIRSPLHSTQSPNRTHTHKIFCTRLSDLSTRIRQWLGADHHWGRDWLVPVVVPVARAATAPGSAAERAC